MHHHHQYFPTLLLIMTTQLQSMCPKTQYFACSRVLLWPFISPVKLPPKIGQAQAVALRLKKIRYVDLAPKCRATTLGMGEPFPSSSPLTDLVKSFYEHLNKKDMKKLKEQFDSNCVFEDLAYPSSFKGEVFFFSTKDVTADGGWSARESAGNCVCQAVHAQEDGRGAAARKAAAHGRTCVGPPIACGTTGHALSGYTLRFAMGSLRRARLLRQTGRGRGALPHRVQDSEGAAFSPIASNILPDDVLCELTDDCARVEDSTGHIIHMVF
ncbi:hypothetical protein KSP40_PGU019886 [Platanthera guangdongensis]|uniref:Uncharacterized protein n=1 Tax=Platanthera guangdongensis TaxID=2320717 RepID=A0ABR2LNU3_9ASPA